MQQRAENMPPYETYFNRVYDDLPKKDKKYMKKLKRKMLRTNREQAYLYKALYEEVKQIATNEQQSIYPDINERTHELTTDLPKIDILKEMKGQISFLLIMMTLFFIIKSFYHLVVGTSYTITGREMFAFILFFIYQLDYIKVKSFRVLYTALVILFVVLQDYASNLVLLKLSASISFIIASFFVIITLFFRKK